MLFALKDSSGSRVKSDTEIEAGAGSESASESVTGTGSAYYANRLPNLVTVRRSETA